MPVRGRRQLGMKTDKNDIYLVISFWSFFMITNKQDVESTIQICILVLNFVLIKIHKR
jgi:hypothetical protein